MKNSMQNYYKASLASFWKYLSVLTIFFMSFISPNVSGQTQISDEQGLKSIAGNLSGTFTLTADITLISDWTPIGTDDAPFTGIINGNGHTIKNLKFKDATANNVGFIGVASGATISGIGFEKIDIQGRTDVGAVVGKATATTVEKCFSAGLIQGYDHVGGIVGGTYATTPAGEGKSAIRNCYSTAEIISSTYQSAGILGVAGDVDIANVYFSGVATTPSSNTGGIVSLPYGGSEVYGPSALTITNSVVMSPYLKGRETNTRRILANKGDNDKGLPRTLTNNYARADMLINGIPVETNDPLYGTNLEHGANKTVAELTNTALYTQLNWSTDIWNLANGRYPIFSWQASSLQDIDRVAGFPLEEQVYITGTQKEFPAYSTFGLAVTYDSSNPAVATVSQIGTINCLSAGTTIISASTAGNSTVKATQSQFTIKVLELSPSIRTAEDLINIRYKPDGTFTLENDITLTANWEPITGFTGTLNGNGKVIRGLKYNNPAVNNVGLFGEATGATITKLGIEDAEIIGNVNSGAIVGRALNTTITECYVANSYIEGSDHVGSIVGGIIPNESGSTLVQNSYATAQVHSRATQAGGIAGTMGDGIIDKCFFSGIVSTQSSNAGGMVSLLDNGTEQSISNSVCLAPMMLGNNVGRILATKNNKEITLINNYARFDVMKGITENALQGFSTEDPNVALDGLNGLNITRAGSLSANFYKTQLQWDMDNIWKMAGEGVIYPILAWQQTPVVATVLNLPRTTVRLPQGGESLKVKAYGSMGQPIYFDSPQENKIITLWVEYKEVEGVDLVDFILIGTVGSSLTLGTATINAETDPTAFLTKSARTFDVEVLDPGSLKKKINSIEDLKNMKDDLLGNYRLETDLDLASVGNWTPIGDKANPFKGALDGNGYVISNLTYSGANDNNIGLFGYASGATVQNLALENVNIVAKNDVGAIAGGATGMTISKVSVTGYVEGSDHVGGLVGMTFTEKSSVISDSYYSGDINTRLTQAGGLVGVAQSTKITRSYFEGTVTAPTVDWQKNGGGIVGLSYDGGNELDGVVCLATSITAGTTGAFIARGTVATINQCLYRADAIISAPADPTNTGYEDPPLSSQKPLFELQKEAAYTAIGWDFETIWKIEGTGFPVLRRSHQVGVKPAVEKDSKYAYTLGGKLYVAGVERADITVYDINGHMINKVYSSGENTGILLNTRGIYIIRIEEGGVSTARKIIL